MHQSWMSVLQGLAIQESCHASCILHVCHMQGQSTLHCKMDGRMDARTMPCILLLHVCHMQGQSSTLHCKMDGWMDTRTMPYTLHSTCRSHARTVHPPLQDGWTDGCKMCAKEVMKMVFVNKFIGLQNPYCKHAACAI